MESIHPNDITTLDMDQISYVTMKNGNMILVDDTVPQKSNTENKNIPGPSSSGVSESKVQKDIILEISSPYTLSFEGNNDTNKNKSNFKICSEVIKNISFTFDGIKTNNNKNNNDEQLNNKENISTNSMRPYLKENAPQEVKNVQNNNNNENDINFSKIEKIDFNQSNVNTNLSIPIMNFSNNNADNKSANNALNRRKSRASRIFGVGGTGRKSRISVNAVCTLNIKAEEKYKINLINQFNGIVDKLNAEREKKPIYELIDNEKNKNNLKFYEFYKNKPHSTLRKSKEILNQNYITEGNNDYNNGINHKRNHITLNNFNKKNSYDFIGLNNNNFGIRMFNDNYGKSPSKLSTSKPKNFRDKIIKYSSDLVLPSNKMSPLLK